MPVGSFGCGGRSKGWLQGVASPVFGQVGCELADEELLKEILDGAAGDAEGGVFEG